eukprot:g15516.t1
MAKTSGQTELLRGGGLALGSCWGDHDECSLVESLKRSCAALLYGLLELRRDTSTARMLARRLSPNTIRRRLLCIYAKFLRHCCGYPGDDLIQDLLLLQSSTLEDKLDRASRKPWELSFAGDRECQEFFGEAVNLIMVVETVALQGEAAAVGKFLEEVRPQRRQRSSDDPDPVVLVEKVYARAFGFFRSLIAAVEICLPQVSALTAAASSPQTSTSSQLTRYFFQKPLACKYALQSTKTKLLTTVPVSNAQAKLKFLVEFGKTGIQRLCATKVGVPFFFTTLHPMHFFFKEEQRMLQLLIWLSLVIAGLINVVLCLTLNRSRKEEHIDLPLPVPLVLPLALFDLKEDAASGPARTSLRIYPDAIVRFLGTLSLLVAAVRLAVRLLLYWPLAVKRERERRWGTTSSSFRSSPYLRVYLRSVFRMLLEEPLLRALVLFVFSLLALVKKELGLNFYAYMLFDLFFTHEIMRNLFRAILNPLKQLAFTGLMMLIVLYAFALTAYSQRGRPSDEAGHRPCIEFFEPRSQLQFPPSDYLMFDVYGREVDQIGNEKSPSSFLGRPELFSWFFVTMYDIMVPGPTLPISNGAEFQARFLFDVLFYVVIEVVLMNIIFGLIIDNFGALRDETATRAEYLENYCFICGLSCEEIDHALREKAEAGPASREKDQGGEKDASGGELRLPTEK